MPFFVEKTGIKRKKQFKEKEPLNCFFRETAFFSKTAFDYAPT
jgi:hypothetical protein